MPASSCVRASHHQADARYSSSSRGRQCTAMSVAAVAVSANTAVGTWGTRDIDQILLLGDKLYNRARGTGTDAVHLSPDEVPESFTHKNCHFSVKVDYTEQCGQHSDDSSAELLMKLRDFFKDETKCVVVSCALTVAVFKLQGGKYALFDSHARDRFGRYAKNGTAVITQHATVKSVADTITSNYGFVFSGQYFAICKVNVSSQFSSVQPSMSVLKDQTSVPNAAPSRETKKQRKSRLHRESEQKVVKTLPSSLEKKTDQQKRSEGNKADKRLDKVRNGSREGDKDAGNGCEKTCSDSRREHGMRTATTDCVQLRTNKTAQMGVQRERKILPTVHQVETIPSTKITNVSKLIQKTRTEPKVSKNSKEVTKPKVQLPGCNQKSKSHCRQEDGPHKPITNTIKHTTPTVEVEVRQDLEVATSRREVEVKVSPSGDQTLNKMGFSNNSKLTTKPSKQKKNQQKIKSKNDKVTKNIIQPPRSSEKAGCEDRGEDRYNNDYRSEKKKSKSNCEGSTHRQFTEKQQKTKNLPLKTKVRREVEVATNAHHIKTEATVNRDETSEQTDLPTQLCFVRASRHQADGRFSLSSRGRQCTAMSVAAVALSENTAIETWQSSDLDSILLLGDELYKRARDKGTDNVHLAPDEVPESFTHKNCHYSVKVNYTEHCGQHSDDSSAQLLMKLQDFFKDETKCVVVSCALTVAVFKLQGGKYALFDSHARNRFGRYAKNGTAVITQHATVKSLADTIISNFGCGFSGQYFAVCKVNVNSRSNSVQPSMRAVKDQTLVPDAVPSRETKKQRKSRIHRERQEKVRNTLPSCLEKKTDQHKKSQGNKADKIIEKLRNKSRGGDSDADNRNDKKYNESRGEHGMRTATTYCIQLTRNQTNQVRVNQELKCVTSAHQVETKGFQTHNITQFTADYSSARDSHNEGISSEPTSSPTNPAQRVSKQSTHMKINPDNKAHSPLSKDKKVNYLRSRLEIANTFDEIRLPLGLSEEQYERRKENGFEAPTCLQSIDDVTFMLSIMNIECTASGSLEHCQSTGTSFSEPVSSVAIPSQCDDGKRKHGLISSDDKDYTPPSQEVEMGSQQKFIDLGDKLRKFLFSKREFGRRGRKTEAKLPRGIRNLGVHRRLELRAGYQKRRWQNLF